MSIASHTDPSALRFRSSPAPMRCSVSLASSTFFLCTDTVMYRSRSMRLPDVARSTSISLYSCRYPSSASPLSGISESRLNRSALTRWLFTVILVAAPTSSELISSPNARNMDCFAACDATS